MQRLFSNSLQRAGVVSLIMLVLVSLGAAPNAVQAGEQSRKLLLNGSAPMAGEIIAYWELGASSVPNHTLRLCGPGGCSQTSSYGVFAPGIIVNAGDTVSVELFNNNEGGAAGFACGGWSGGQVSPRILGNEWEDFNDGDCNDVRIEVGYRPDSTPPVTTASINCTAGSVGWCRSAATVTLSATDTGGTGVATTFYNGSPYGGPVTIATEGATSFTYYSVDNRGNTETTQNGSVMIDTVAPTVSQALAGTTGLAGWYVSPVTVTLTANDGTSGLGTTTFDGSGYSSPVNITTPGSSSHSYFAQDLAGNASPTQTFNLQIDTAAPGTSVTTHSNGQPVTGSITLGGAHVDPASGVSSVAISTNGGASWMPVTLGSGVWSYGLDTTAFNDGPLTVLVQATDVAGNVQPASGPGSTSVSLLIDNTDPTVTHALSGTTGLAGWFVSEVVVVLNASDGGSGIGSLSLNGSPYSSPVTITTQGASNLPYIATDNAGNTSATGTAAFQIDSIPPATTLTSHASGDPVRGTINLGGAVSDATSGVASVEISVTGGAFTPVTVTSGNWTHSIDTTTLGDGTVSVVVRGTDIAGNQQATSGPGSTSLSLLVDNTAPTINYSLNGTLGLAGWYVSDVVVTLAANDGGSGIESVTLDGAPYSSPVTVSTQGPTAWQYFATDNAGNGSATGNLSFQLDSIRPASTITSHTGGEFESGLVTLSGAVSDAMSGVAGLDVSVDGGATWSAASMASTVWSYELDTALLADGPVTVLTRAQDVAGNQQATSGGGATAVTIEVDNTPPIGSLTAPSAFCPVCGDTINITYSASDANGIVTWVLSDGASPLDNGSGEPLPGATYLWDGVGVSIGDHTLTFTITDAAGNVTALTAVVTLIYPDPPSATINLSCSLPGDHGWCRAPVTVHLAGSVGGVTIDHLNYAYDGASSVASGSAHSFAETVPAVTHGVSLTATDALGRTSPTVKADFKLDGEAPVIVLGSSTPTQLNVRVSDAHSGILRWTLQVFDSDGQSVFWTERTSTFSGTLDWLPARSGQYEIEVFARDWAGNESTSGREPFAVELPVLAQIVNPILSAFLPPVRPAGVATSTAVPTQAATEIPSPTPQASPAPASTPVVVAELPPVVEPEPAMLVSISGIVYRDFNRDGQQNGNEPGLGNVQIKIIIGGSGQVITITTAPDGTYTLDLPRGKRYVVEIVTPNGLFLTTSGSTLIMENESRRFSVFGLGQSPLPYWLFGLFGMFGLVWLGSSALDRRAGAVRSLSTELQHLASRRLRRADAQSEA